MQTFDTIMTRRSVRQFDTKRPISQKEIHTLLEAAFAAPSAMNKRPWQFLVVTDVQRLEQIRQTHPYAQFVLDAGCAIIIVADKSACYEEYWRVDPLLAGENILLAARDIGLGTCWCGIYPNEERMREMKHLFDIPEPFEPMALIVVGTPLQEQVKLNRYQADKVHLNKW